MAFDPDKLHGAAMEINRHPGVSHNYAREGSYYNLWFTLAVPPEHDLEATAKHMGRKTGAMESRIMPTIRFFKIGVNFDMVKQQGSSYNFSPDGFDKSAADSWNKPQPVTEWEKDAIRGMQEDLPLVSRPFDPIAEKPGHHHGGTVRAGGELPGAPHHAPVQRGVASPPLRVPLQRHDCLEGAAEERSEEVGMIMAGHKAVTHCYERPTFPDWPYTHFTMVHATTPEGCEQYSNEISEATGITDRLALYSTREYKKTRVRYFVPDYDEYLETEAPGALATAD